MRLSNLARPPRQMPINTRNGNDEASIVTKNHETARFTDSGGEPRLSRFPSGKIGLAAMTQTDS